MIKTSSIICLLLIMFGGNLYAQTLPASRSVDWTVAGLKDTSTLGFTLVDMSAQGAIGDGLTPNDLVLTNVLSSGGNQILYFPAGNFVFNQTLHLPENTILRGSGANQTTITLDLGGTGDGISAQGQLMSDTTTFIETGHKYNNWIRVNNPTLFNSSDWVRIIQNDTDLVTSSWAHYSVGQMIQINDISADTIFFESELRMDYDTSRVSYIRRVVPVSNVGLECLKIDRLDETNPIQTSNVNFSYAVNCWVDGIESNMTNYSHVEARYSSNLAIRKSYFHHGFDYGGGGRAYGVTLHFTTNECLVEDNIFKRLRHSMILQGGANGNVFAFNYSTDPFWYNNTPSDTSNSGGDMVLHGNYVFSNLFEQNVCQNIVIDNSHGPNGPHNTFFRNTAGLWGIFFSASNSPDQNFLGNDVTNSGIPYNFLNYTILGSGHFIHGNNDKGTIKPTGTQTLPDTSYAYSQRPNFVPLSGWASIGTPNTLGTGSIPAKNRFINGYIHGSSCGNSVGIKNFERIELALYPNPATGIIHIQWASSLSELKIYDSHGRVFLTKRSNLKSINLSSLPSGIYYLEVMDENGEIGRTKLVKE